MTHSKRGEMQSVAVIWRDRDGQTHASWANASPADVSMLAMELQVAAQIAAIDARPADVTDQPKGE